jgi:hypothetical protein
MQQGGDSAVAEPRPLAHQFQHSLQQRGFILARLRRSPLTRPRLTQDATSPSLGRRELVLQFADRFTLPGRAHQFPSAMCLSI